VWKVIQQVGSERLRLFKSVRCLVFVEQIESKALVESELNFLGRLVGGGNIQLCTHSQHAHDITCKRVLSPSVSVGIVYCTAVQGRHRPAKDIRLVVFKGEGCCTRWETARLPSEDSICPVAHWLHAHRRSENSVVQLSSCETDRWSIHFTYRGYRSGMEAVLVKHRGRMQCLIHTEKTGSGSYGSAM